MAVLADLGLAFILGGVLRLVGRARLCDTVTGLAAIRRHRELYPDKF